MIPLRLSKRWVCVYWGVEALSLVYLQNGLVLGGLIGLNGKQKSLGQPRTIFWWNSVEIRSRPLVIWWQCVGPHNNIIFLPFMAEICWLPFAFIFAVKTDVAPNFKYNIFHFPLPFRYFTSFAHAQFAHPHSSSIITYIK